MRIWIDVEDIFIFAAAGRTPTGIQRLAFEMCRALHETYGDQGGVRLLRQCRARNGFIEIPWQALDALFARLANRDDPAPPEPEPEPIEEPSPELPPEAPPEPPPEGWRGPVRRALRPAFRQVPTRLRPPLADFVRLQARAVYALGDLILAMLRAVPALACAARRGFRAPPAPVETAPPAPPELEMPDIVEPPPPEPEAGDPWLPANGDVVFIAGAAWYNPAYADLLAEARTRFGVRVALLIYDIIPLRRPEWCDRQHASAFAAWFDSVVPLCDILFAISQASADEVLDYATRKAIPLRDRIHPVPIGAGFAPSRTSLEAAAASAAAAALPEPGSYVLFVSTIEARKNHALLFRVWRHLLEQLPADRVPTLVFAGRVGWLVADLMQQLINTQYLDGKIVLVEHPSDDELLALYRGCRFTLFPSLYEGWGLPVTESLALGKPCIISNRTALPEAGGSLARYFDPEDVGDATRVIRATLDDPDGLAAWAAQVEREFRPVSWDETAHAIMARFEPGPIAG